jgi:hypothetical protein
MVRIQFISLQKYTKMFINNLTLKTAQIMHTKALRLDVDT